MIEFNSRVKSLLKTKGFDLPELKKLSKESGFSPAECAAVIFTVARELGKKMNIKKIRKNLE